MGFKPSGYVQMQQTGLMLTDPESILQSGTVEKDDLRGYDNTSLAKVEQVLISKWPFRVHGEVDAGRVAATCVKQFTGSGPISIQRDRKNHNILPLSLIHI